MSLTPRDDFTTQFDLGVPLDPTTERNSHVLMVYNTDSALPHAIGKRQTSLPLLSVADATENCDYLHILLTDHSTKRRQCTAFLGQMESFHIQKWMRLPLTKGKLDPALPLRPVNRGAQSNGRLSVTISANLTKAYWQTILADYLLNYDAVLEELRPIAAKVARKNTIVVLTCNFGQSELLLNFICNARAHHLDLSHVLVYVTDVETYELVSAMNVAVFYDRRNTENMPKAAARRYADKNFRAMMMAKVFCVQLVLALGYDVLFQDVDVVWYRDPIDYFEQDTSDFDLFFQDDGNHAIYYAPYSANTGFYFVRNNQRTQHFFNTFLLSGDLILSTKSHQVPLIALLGEHASLYGIRVKIFPRTSDEFPGGHAFNRRKDFMKELFAGTVHPYVFHMSWTLNKDNKIKYFQQMGEWFIHDQCVQKTARQIVATDMTTTCCSVEPIVTCHYRDKPSKIPCKGKPSIDKGRPSFW